MVVSLGIVDPKGSAGSATVNFDLSISDLNEDQKISEPSGAKPFDQLLSKFGGLGLGGLGCDRRHGRQRSGGGTSGSSGPTRSSRSTRSASPTPAATSPRRASARSC